MIKRSLIALAIAAAVLGFISESLTAAQGNLPQVPDHFRITEFVNVKEATSGFYRYPTAISIGPDGRLYVALLGGRIYAFEDTDGDDRQDVQQLFASGLLLPADMAWREEALYVAVEGGVRRLEDLDDDGDADSNVAIVDDLPEAVRSLAFDSAGRLYLGVPAGCDNCTPTDPRLGTVLRFESSEPYTPTLYAMGLHDPEGLAFYPGTDDLFAVEDGRDDLGPDAPPDELNFIRYREHYGWPHCWEGGSDPGWGLFCTWTVPSIATFPPHSSPAGLVFHIGTGLPLSLTNSAFTGLQELGTVQRVMIAPDGTGGYTASSEPFATGFERPVDVAVGPDGAIYVADYDAQKVYCIRAQPNLSSSSKWVYPVAPDPGERLTYTLSLVVIGPTATFTLTDAIPPSTTYVAGSIWASAGTITQAAGSVRWWGVISSNTTLTASFAVDVGAGVPSRTAIINTAVLTAEADPDSPYTLRAVAIVEPLQGYMPLVLRNW